MNLHTRYNSILLGSKLRDLFNEGKWFLLPEPYILDLYLRGRCNPMSVPPKTSEPYYEYTILPLNGMASVPIARHITDDTGVTTTQTHSFPYPDLGVIHSHVHPHYVIFHAAIFTFTSMADRQQYPEYKGMLGNVLYCYAGWTVRIANLKMMGKFRPSRHSYDESDSESDSLETNPPSTPRCRELPLPQSSLTQPKKVSIEEWRNSVIEGGDEIREVEVQDAQEWEEPSSF